MKTKGSFARTICIWIVTVVIVTVFTFGVSALICRTQIGEAISLHRAEECSMSEEVRPERDEHGFEDKAILSDKITPLNFSQKVALIILAVFWVAIVVLYWFSVTFMLAERAELIKFNRHIWFWLAFFTNIIAVLIFSVIKKVFVKKCKKCGNYQVGGAYCTECGNALEVRCLQCGKILKDGVTYCPQCGKKV